MSTSATIVIRLKNADTGKRSWKPRGYDVTEVPASYNTGSSLADRVRVLTDEEWARLSR